MKYAVMNDREFIRLLKDNGYVVARTAGDHTIYYNEERKDSITVNRKINPIVANRLITEHNLKGE